jgi:hypothetical protein
LSQADDIARRLTAVAKPGLLAAMEARKPAIVASLPWVARELVKLNWSTIVGEVPMLAEAAAAAIITELGSMTLTELASLAARKGNHP